MAKFRFKLAGILRQRKQIEQEMQRRLAVRQRTLFEHQQKLQHIQQSVMQANDDVRRNRLVGRLDMSYLAAHRRFLIGMQHQAVGTVQRIALAQRGVDEARNELAEAAKRRKAIEKLREKQFERWRADLAQREQAELNEIGMQLAYQNLTEDPEPAS